MLMERIRVGLKRIQLTDVRSDKFLLWHRLQLGELLNTQNEVAIFEGIVRILYGIHIQPKHYRRFYHHVKEVIDGLAFWMEKEKALKYQPTPEERQAGIEELGKRVKEFATVDAIARRMHISHDDALKLPYATVYLMLLNDLEQSKFERRLQKVYSKKVK